MDVRFINPFIRSVTRVLATMVRVKAAVGKPFSPDGLAEKIRQTMLTAGFRA